MNAIAETLKTVEVVGTCTNDIFTVHFLCIEQARPVNMLGFKEAVEAGTLQVTEIGDGGETVPEITFNNTSTMPIFIPEGTIIEGMKQSRFIRVSFIISGNTVLNAPCACVEQSRWSYENSAVGHVSEYHLFPSLRATNSRAVHHSLKMRRGYQSNRFQEYTWNRIEHKLSSSRTDSRTGYVGDYYRNSNKDINKLMRGIVFPDDINGYVAMIEDKPIEMTIFGNRDAFSIHSQGLMLGFVAEYFDKQYRKSLKDRKPMTYQDFIEAVIKAEIEQYPSIGLGQDLRFESKELVGSALVNGGSLHFIGAYGL